jgi:hypothetical protein
MTHNPTLELTAPIMAEYVAIEQPRPRLVTGSYIPELDKAAEVAKQTWLEVFGAEVPPEAAFQNYLLTGRDAELIQAEKYRIEDSLSEDQVAALCHKFGIRWGADFVGDIASKIRRRTYQETLDFESHEPDMTIVEDILPGYPLQSSNNWYSSRNPSVDCAVTVFGMNALRLLPPDKSLGKDFHSSTFRQVVEVFGNKRAGFDLPWLLGSLTTPYAAELTQSDVRVAVTIGADFGDIQKKVIQPLRRKAPNLQFMLNAVLTSEVAEKANHIVNIAGAEEEVVSVYDPKYPGQRDVPVEDFWNRWVPANMQTVITIVRPQAAETIQ